MTTDKPAPGEPGRPRSLPSTATDPNRFVEQKRGTAKEADFRRALEQYYAVSHGTNIEKLANFSKYVPVQDLRRFITRYELFKEVLCVHGSILECGVYAGGGLMTWAQLCEIFEPFNHRRSIIGFDTFTGIPSISDNDRKGTSSYLRVGALALDDAQADIERAIALYDQNRVLGHLPKVQLVRGDACVTVPRFVEQNAQLVVGLLYLDFDLYEPTIVALQHLLPRIPRGGIIAFDQLNDETWPGETIAVAEALGISKLRIRRFPFGSPMSYAVID